MRTKCFLTFFTLKLTLLLILCSATVSLAQSYEDILPFIKENLAVYAVSTEAVIIAVTFLTSLALRLWPDATKTQQQMLAWIVAIIFSLIFFFLGIGIYQSMDIWISLASGIFFGLAANGHADFILVKWFLNWIENKPVRSSSF